MNRSPDDPIDRVRRSVRIDAQRALCEAGVTWFRELCGVWGVEGAAFRDVYTLVGEYIEQVTAVWATHRDRSAPPVLLFSRPDQGAP